MNKAVIRPQAGLDLDHIFDYIAADNLERAIKFIGELNKKIEELAEDPGIGRSRSELLPNLRSFRFKNYLIFYIPLLDGIDIVHIWHGARDIQTLFDNEI
jgi:toxin ParE1/3/4